jgi:hypothetical protein
LKERGKVYTLSVWKDTLKDGQLRIAVQVYRHLFLGIGQMAADGFRIDQSGTIRELSKRELYDFI